MKRRVTYQDQRIERVGLGKHFIGAFHTVQRQLNTNPNFTEEFEQDLLVRCVVFH
jgi:hypothetical protein